MAWLIWEKVAPAAITRPKAKIAMCRFMSVPCLIDLGGYGELPVSEPGVFAR